MVTALQQKILSLGKVEFENGVKDTDFIVVQEFRSKGYYYLYNKNGWLLDIQIGEVIDHKLTQKRPKIQSISGQGPVVKKKGRPSKKSITNVAKVVEKNQEKHLTVLPGKAPVVGKQKRQYKMSEEQRQKRSERMRATMKAYWEKKKKA